jgi:hypothetical protein
MNSFNTHEETVRIIRKYRMHNLSIHTFNQVRMIIQKKSSENSNDIVYYARNMVLYMYIYM